MENKKETAIEGQVQEQIKDLLRIIKHELLSADWKNQRIKSVRINLDYSHKRLEITVPLSRICP